VIYGIGFGLSLIVSFVSAIAADSVTAMIAWFVGAIVIGFLGTWAIASLVERRIAGRAVTAGQPVSSQQLLDVCFAAGSVGL